MTNPASIFESLPVFPDGEEMYDQLMGKIEPDLVRSELQKLKEKYRNETPDQKQSRSERYQKAFAEYEKQFKEQMGALDANTHTYQRQALASLEEQDRSSDTQHMHNLDQQISTL